MLLEKGSLPQTQLKPFIIIPPADDSQFTKKYLNALKSILLCHSPKSCDHLHVRPCNVNKHREVELPLNSAYNKEQPLSPVQF